MLPRDPKLIALLFNECITRQSLGELADLMTEGHVFIDRTGKVTRQKQAMLEAWEKFFAAFPHYRNTFSRVESAGNTVAIVGDAYWSADQPHDPVLWSARIEDDQVAEWRIYEDTPENRELLHLG
jgi:ketosteroid isomerase-like protein